MNFMAIDGPSIHRKGALAGSHDSRTTEHFRPIVPEISDQRITRHLTICSDSKGPSRSIGAVWHQCSAIIRCLFATKEQARGVFQLRAKLTSAV
jgi:hypothetical protein